MGLLRLAFVILLVALCGRAVAQTKPLDLPQAGQQEGTKLIHTITELLIAKGLCADRQDCVKKQYALSATVSAGLNVYLYQVSDAELLSDVIKQCALVALRRPDMRRIEVKIYAISKAEALETPFFVRVPHKSITIEN
jgi:hypothetical protein